MRKTKIICTIGPSTQEYPILKKLILAGMNVARLNFSHGSYQQFSKIIINIKKINKQLRKNVTLIGDLQGFKIRIGFLENPLLIQDGEEIKLSYAEKCKKVDGIPILYPLHKYIKPAERIFISDGLIELAVKSIQNSSIIAKVTRGGKVSSFKGINIPDTIIENPPLTDEDRNHILFSIKNNIDFLALSFVKSKQDIIAIKEYLRLHKVQKKIIAKIERKEAVENIKDIIQEADAIMVARGDLGVETGAERVPLIQKRILDLCNQIGKPVIIATQILTSMIENPIPTRAEISDISNSILDKADGLLLSDETAIGKYPINAVKIINKTALLIEKHINSKPFIHEKASIYSPIAISDNAVKIANEIKAKYIVACTESGFTVAQIIKHRPLIPVIAFTSSKKTMNDLTLFWGINKIFLCQSFSLSSIIKVLNENHLLNKGNKIIIASSGKKESYGISDSIIILKYD